MVYRYIVFQIVCHVSFLVIVSTRGTGSLDVKFDFAFKISKGLKILFRTVLYCLLGNSYLKEILRKCFLTWFFHWQGSDLPLVELIKAL